jgi:hypothetical protein
MWWLINFPMRYGVVIVVAAWAAANQQPLWVAAVIALGGVLILPFYAPERARNISPPYFAELVIQTPYVTLAAVLGSLVGRFWRV